MASFSDGQVRLSNDVQSVRSGELVYSGQLVKSILPFRGGFLTAFEDGGVYWSPDGHDPGGGGASNGWYCSLNISKYPDTNPGAPLRCSRKEERG
jgi:hypothetical protein